MKWVGLLKVFDHELCGQWHSGSCTYYKAKTGFDTKEEAADWVIKMQHEHYHNDTKQYSFTPAVLAYDETESINVEQFFKYM